MRTRYAIICLTFLCSCSSVKRTVCRTSHGSFVPEKEQLLFDSCFVEAQKEKILGNYNQQKLLLQKCLEIKPYDPSVSFSFSNYYLSLGKKREALYYARKAATYDKTNEWLLLQVARIYQLLDMNDSSCVYYKRLLRLDPGNYDYNFKLAVLDYECRKYRASLRLIEKLEDENGPSGELYLVKYKCYLSLNNNKECIKTLKLACANFPNEVRFYGLLAEHYAAIGDDQLALNYYQRLLKVDPDNEKAYLSLIDFYKTSKRTEEALKIAKNFIANANYSADNKVEILSAYLNDRFNFAIVRNDIKVMIDSLLKEDAENLNFHILLANYYLRINGFQEAKKEYEFLISKSKNNSVIWQQMLFVLNSVNDNRGMLELTDSAISLFKNEPVFYLYRGIAFYQSKQYVEAIGVFKTGINLITDENDLLLKFYTFLGESYNATKQFAESDDAFEQSLKIDPNNVLILNNYSYYLAIRNQKLDLALIYISRCLKLEPKNFTFLDTYAWVLFKKGKLKESRKVMEEVESYGGFKNVNMLEHYSEILLSLGLRNEALIYYYRIREMGRESNRLRLLLNLTE